MYDQFYQKQYHLQDEDTRLVIDVLSVFIYPLERYTLISAVHHIKPVPQKRIIGILQQLTDERLGSVNVAGNFSLAPELSFLRFPVNIKRPEYLRLLDHTNARIYSFYSTSIRLQEVQQLLTAFFTGERSLLLQPVRKIEFTLDEYLPHLFYLLYYPAYDELLKLFSPESIAKIFSHAVEHRLLKMAPLADLDTFRENAQTTLGIEAIPHIDPAMLLLKGQLAVAGNHTGNVTVDDIYAKAVLLLYDRQPEQALSAFEQGIKLQRKQDKKNTIPTSPLFSFYYAITLVLLPAVQVNPVITKITGTYDKKLFPAVIPAISLLLFHTGKKEKAENMLQILLETALQDTGKKLPAWLSLLSLQLFHPKSKLLRTHETLVKVLLKQGIDSGYRVPVYEYLYLYKDQAYLGYEKEFQEIAALTGKRPLLSQMQKTADWERILNTLLLPDTTPVKKEKNAVTVRLAYLIDIDHYMIQPVLQTMQGGTEWSKGRNVALKRMKDGKAEAMTEQDHRIAATISKGKYYIHGSESYAFEEKAWHEIPGHPYLFLMEEPTVPVEIVKGAPELIVNKTGKGYTFSTNITDYTRETTIVKEINTRLNVIRLSPQQRSLLQTLKQIDAVPEEGKEKLLQVLRTIGAHITIHSDLDDTAVNIKKLAADPRIRIQLLPFGKALKAAFFVKPFGDDPPYCKPGIGAQNIIGVRSGERCQATRNLEAEKRNAALLMEYIQQAITQEIDEDTIMFEDPLDCLQLLEIIQNHPDIVVAEWPEGERFRIHKQVNSSHFHIILKTNGRWFDFDGQLKVDDETVLSLKELLDNTKSTHSRFIKLQSGEFLALTAALRRRLDELSGIVITERNTLKIGQMTAHMLDELLETAGSVTTDSAWDAFRNKWNDAKELDPQIPSTLQTTLRSYQEEGFRWMARLAEWGAGACLADDMGLGKTIQSIAILLYRANHGPALVVCPASVLPNWTNEITRFAPSLRVIQLNTGNRIQQLKAAAGFDVVITTYGLLQSEEKLLAGIHWSTIVLDEAHTIKNYQTKTAKAAMSLKADFKLILTGTPLQNHLEEIWSLFNFINPGLLGTLQHFNKQFTTPVVYNPDSSVKKHLKKLLAPFILRRTKADVLDELPSKTEIIKLVSLSPDEAAFYEALRLKAIENIKKHGGNNGKLNLNTLTEIGKLRMAACHPQMIDTSVSIPSSKLAVFLEIAEELISNNHRALVFSQFVRHLDLVKRALDNLEISYLYLDGSTPIAVREKLVKQFQAGEADLFLISLKAGGLGLNLTAADYVIHLDPWWNPAIEEQASDRAHRIGQTRPVTIYRLVAQHTIEEKIISLHHSKRDLADQLLQGTDQAARLSAGELLELITDN